VRLGGVVDGRCSMLLARDGTDLMRLGREGRRTWDGTRAEELDHGSALGVRGSLAESTRSEHDVLYVCWRYELRL
jgi:hypothetical protein